MKLKNRRRSASHNYSSFSKKFERAAKTPENLHSQTRQIRRMTMMTQDSPAGGASDRILDPMSRVSLSRSTSGDSFVVEEKKSGDATDMQRMLNKSNNKHIQSSHSNFGGQEYRHMISSEPGSKFLPESGRYQLFLSRACPNSHLALMVRSLKGLESVISINYVQSHPYDHLERNWMIDLSNRDNVVTNMDSSSSHHSFASLKSDTSYEFTTIREIYQKEGDNSSNSIPLLYDNTFQTIVNNDTEDICSMFNSCFDRYVSKQIKINLPSSKDDATQMEIQQWLYPLLSLTHSPVPPYLYTFCPQQINVALNRAAHILGAQQYLTGSETITQADLKLFATLIRYDQVYATYLSHPRRVMQNPALLDYCRDIYQQPGVADTVDMDEIQSHFLGKDVATCSSNGGKALLNALKTPHQRHLV